MKLLFIDEISGNKEINKDLFGLSVIQIDLTKYSKICKEFNDCLKKYNWPQDEELKGRYLFSRDPAGQKKTPDEMVAMTDEIVGSLVSDKNARGNVLFYYNYNGNNFDNYLKLLNKAINDLQKCGKCNGGKNLAMVFLDYSDYLFKNIDRLNSETCISLKKRNYALLEKMVTLVSSSNNAVGIVYADVLAYICRWFIENPKNNDLTLFDFGNDYNLKRKITTIYGIVNKIKSIKLVELKQP